MIINILAIFGVLFIILIISYVWIELIEDIYISNKLKKEGNAVYFMDFRKKGVIG